MIFYSKGEPIEGWFPIETKSSQNGELYFKVQFLNLSQSRKSYDVSIAQEMGAILKFVFQQNIFIFSPFSIIMNFSFNEMFAFENFVSLCTRLIWFFKGPV